MLLIAFPKLCGNKDTPTKIGDGCPVCDYIAVSDLTRTKGYVDSRSKFVGIAQVYPFYMPLELQRPVCLCRNNAHIHLDFEDRDSQG